MKSKKRRLVVKLTAQTIGMTICFALLFAVIWINSFFRGLNMEQILFHIKAPLQGTDPDSIFSGLLRIGLPAFFIASLWLGLILYLRRLKLMITLPVWLSHIISYLKKLNPFKKRQTGMSHNQRNVTRPASTLAGRMAGMLSISVVILAVYLANQYFSLFQYIEDQKTASVFIEEHYVSPINGVTFPEEKRNLIYIYLESMENTFASADQGGAYADNYIPELVRLAENHTSFSHTDGLGGAQPVSGTTWTMASMFAQSTGLPLKIPIKDNSMSKHTEFFPGVVSIGDLLLKNGYHNYLMIGSDATFGGRRQFFKQHGQYEIFDYVSAKEDGYIDEDYRVWWGFEDVKLFDFAREELLRLSSQDQPFNFTMLTVDTHHEDGYACDYCSERYDIQYANVLACASRHVNRFITWIQQQDFYDNTTIVLVGDHLTMDTDFAENINPDYIRTTYNVFINPAPLMNAQRTTNRQFTAFDMLPTTLASLGASIEQNRIGLGTNLFSNQDTLFETYGQNFIQELNQKSRFYDREFIYRSQNGLDPGT